MQDSNCAGIFPVVIKLRRIVKNQNSGVRRGESLACRSKVSGKNIRFVDAVIGQKTISGFCMAQSWQTREYSPLLRRKAVRKTFEIAC